MGDIGDGQKKRAQWEETTETRRCKSPCEKRRVPVRHFGNGNLFQSICLSQVSIVSMCFSLSLNHFNEFCLSPRCLCLNVLTNLFCLICLDCTVFTLLNLNASISLLPQFFQSLSRMSQSQSQSVSIVSVSIFLSHLSPKCLTETLLFSHGDFHPRVPGGFQHSFFWVSPVGTNLTQ